MPGSSPQTGDVYYYPYLWKRQGAWADPEKDRPCCVAIRLQSSLRGSNIFMLAITQSGVPEGGFGVVIPHEHVRNLRRLSLETPTFLVTSEFNSDLADHPNFADHEYLGTLPLEYIKSVGKEFVAQIRSGLGEVNRATTPPSASSPSTRG